MNDNRFLLTYLDYKLGHYYFSWYQTEEEMMGDINRNPEWSHLEATEIFSCRDIEIKS